MGGSIYTKFEIESYNESRYDSRRQTELDRIERRRTDDGQTTDEGRTDGRTKVGWMDGRKSKAKRNPESAKEGSTEGGIEPLASSPIAGKIDRWISAPAVYLHTPVSFLSTFFAVTFSEGTDLHTF